MIFRLYFKVIVKPELFWFDNDFEIESKYHRKAVVWLLIAHILSLQDVVLRSMFFLTKFHYSQRDPAPDFLAISVLILSRSKIYVINNLCH